MDKYATHKPLQVATLALASVVMSGCEMGDDRDPRVAARELGPPPTYDSPRIEPAVGTLVGQQLPVRPAAPMAESAAIERAVRPAIESQVVVVGRNAAATVSDRARRMFASTVEDHRTEFLVCSDREAIEMLMVGRADFGLIGGTLSSREIHAGLRQTFVGVELFALAVAPESQVRSLTRTQVRDIFTGKVTDWQQLGFPCGPIVPIAPSNQKARERAARVLMPGDAFASVCLRATDERSVADHILQHPGAIAVTRVTDAPQQAGQKLLQIDWTGPSLSAFGYGTYPFGVPLHIVTSGRLHAQAQAFVDFAKSSEGQRQLAATILSTN